MTRRTVERDGYRWPDDVVLWHTLLDEAPDFEIPYKVRVFVFRDQEALAEACEDPLAGAHSLSFHEPDDANARALVMLAQPVQLSAVSHEVAHIALFWARDMTRRRQRALGWLDRHPESVPELVGNLTAIIWYSLPEQYRDDR